MISKVLYIFEKWLTRLTAFLPTWTFHKGNRPVTFKRGRYGCDGTDDNHGKSAVRRHCRRRYFSRIIRTFCPIGEGIEFMPIGMFGLRDLPDTWRDLGIQASDDYSTVVERKRWSSPPSCVTSGKRSGGDGNWLLVYVRSPSTQDNAWRWFYFCWILNSFENPPRRWCSDAVDVERLMTAFIGGCVSHYRVANLNQLNTRPLWSLTRGPGELDYWASIGRRPALILGIHEINAYPTRPRVCHTKDRATG